MVMEAFAQVQKAKQGYKGAALVLANVMSLPVHTFAASLGEVYISILHSQEVMFLAPHYLPYFLNYLQGSSIQVEYGQAQAE